MTLCSILLRTLRTEQTLRIPDIKGKIFPDIRGKIFPDIRGKIFPDPTRKGKIFPDPKYKR